MTGRQIFELQYLSIFVLCRHVIINAMPIQINKLSVLLVCYLLLTSNLYCQSPYELDRNRLELVVGNTNDHSGSRLVQITNIDTNTQYLVWDLDNQLESVDVGVLDLILSHPTSTVTACGTSWSYLLDLEPNITRQIGIHRVVINDLESLDFPAHFRMFLYGDEDCSVVHDTIFVDLIKAPIEDYSVEFDKDEITVHLDQNTGRMSFPHEVLRVLNTSEFDINLKWEINTEDIPEEILFEVQGWGNDLGVHGICDVENNFFNARNDIYGRPFKIEKVDARDLDDWTGFPYQCSIDLMLPGCDTIFDSVIVNLVSGLTSTKESNMNEIVLSPNPTSDLLIIESNVEISKVQILTFSGEIILETKKGRIDMSSSDSGVYFARVYDSFGAFTTRKFIVAQ